MTKFGLTDDPNISQLALVNEPGLYYLIFTSRKKEAKKFQRWVRHEVLPAIRKTGGYELPGRPKTGSGDVSTEKIKTAQAKMLLAAAKDFRDVLSSESVQLLVGKATEIICGVPLLPLPEVEKDYSAEEIGRLAGLSANMIGRLANAHNLKTEEHGKYVLDKSLYSDKQVATFRYNERGKDKLLELAVKLKAENERRGSKRKAAGEKQEEGRPVT